MFRKVARLIVNAGGNAAVSFAVAAPAVFSALGLASDFAIFSMKRSELQAMADQAAILAANELMIGNTSKTSIGSAVIAYNDHAIAGQNRSVKPESSVGVDSTSVTVRLTENWVPFFAQYIGAEVTPVSVAATASLVGESKICVLALDESSFGAVHMTRDAHMQAEGCTVYSNSANSSGVRLADNSSIDAGLVCSVGGVTGRRSDSFGKVMTDCPVINDPLASRPVPAVGPCDHNGLKLTSGTTTLEPGVYCKGLRIDGTAKVTFAKGNYIIKDGPFVVRKQAEVEGVNVAFFLTGSAAAIRFKDDATINLSGAEDGAMAGLLFFEDPGSPKDTRHEISASKARTLTGTIYLPNGRLVVDPNTAVGENSAYTAIIAHKLNVDNGPTLVLNSNYSATKVPVPPGIKSSANVVLTD